MDVHRPSLPPRTRVYEDVDSDRTSAVTYETTETESSATTVWGPGTLSGKAIKSLGEASLRGVEKLIVRRRLARINAILPGLGSASSQSKSSASGEQLEKIYDDLLELSRLDFYDAKIRQKALRLIMMQIGSRETTQLLYCIVKWPQEEMIIFLSELVPLLWYVNTAALETDMKGRLDLIAVYRSSQLPSEAHDVLPFIDFISLLAREHESSCRAVIESGILDALVVVCDHCTFDESPAVVAAVQQVIKILLECQRTWDVVRAPQRLNLAWPRINPRIPLCRTSLDLAHRTPKGRKKLWLASPSSVIMERLCEIAVILSMSELHLGCEKDMFDVSFDLLVFCDLDITKGSFTELSMFYLSQIIAIGGDFRLAFQHVLNLIPYHNRVDFLYRIIHPLSRMQIKPIPTAIKFCQEVKARHPNMDPVNFFVHFVMDFADSSQENAQAIIDAEIMTLITANRDRIPHIQDVLQRIQNARMEQHNLSIHDASGRPRAGTV